MDMLSVLTQKKQSKKEIGGALVQLNSYKVRKLLLFE